MKAPVGTEVRVERSREDKRVRNHRPPGVVAHEQRGSGVGNAVQATNLSPEVGAHDGAPDGKDPTDVVGVPPVDVVAVERVPEVRDIVHRDLAPGDRTIDGSGRSPQSRCKT